MPQLITLNAAGKELSAPIKLDRKRNRLPQVIAHHVDRSRPFMIAVQRESELEKPLGESWVLRGWKRAPVKDGTGRIVTPGVVNPWPRKYLARDCTVVVVYLPHGGGGGGGGGGGRSKSALSIVAGIAGLALLAFAGPLAAALTPVLGLAGASFAGISAAAFVQGSAALGGSGSVSFKPRAEAQARSNFDDLVEYMGNSSRNLHDDGWTDIHRKWSVIR